jgi:hypothetical protein
MKYKYIKRLTDNNWTNSWRYYIKNETFYKTWYYADEPSTPMTTAFWWIKHDRIYTTSELLSEPRIARVMIFKPSTKNGINYYTYSRVSIFRMKLFSIINLSDCNQAF